MSKVHKTAGLTNHPLQKIYSLIKHRCNHPNSPIYKYYGGRGIKVCEEWSLSVIPFYNWCIENGWGKGLEIDRIDNNKGYSPENCRIVSHKINSRNRSNQRMIEYNGETRCMSEWAEILGIEINAFSFRIKNWTLNDAFTKPIRKITPYIRNNKPCATSPSS